jgi:pilus assembly protein CpaB
VSVRTILIVVLALVCGGSAAIGVNLYSRFGAPRPDTVPVLVATKTIPRGSTLAGDQVKVVSWPRDLLPPGAITRIEDAAGRVVFTQIVKDEPVLDTSLGARNAKGGLASLVPAGMRAYTILTPNVSSGVAGFILPGNKVDVLLTPSADEKAGGAVTTTLLQNVEILAVDTRLEAPNENKVDPRQLQSVTLLVTPDQSAKLNLAQDRGVLHLSLRNPEDTAAAHARPATLAGLQFHQEPPWTEHLKGLLEAYAKAQAQLHRNEDKAAASVEAKAPGTAVADAPLPPMEIRTLRGKYSGVVQIGQMVRESDGR